MPKYDDVPSKSSYRSLSKTPVPPFSESTPRASPTKGSSRKFTTPKRSNRFDPYGSPSPSSRRSARLARRPPVNFSESRPYTAKELGSPTRSRGASPTLSELLNELSPPPFDLLTPSPERSLSPSKLKLERKVRTYVKPEPVYLPAPALPDSRLKIDALNVGMFAEDDAVDEWTSAFSFERFGGPRRMAPFRELHRLTDPPYTDISDWAENVRWAKEQHAAFGSVWVENEYDLERITEWRRENEWVSDVVWGKRMW